MSAKPSDVEPELEEAPEAVDSVEEDVAADGSEEADGNEAEGDAEDEAANLKGQLMRLRADFDNFRKRTTRERGEVAQRANENIIFEMLTVIDHMDLAIQSAAGSEEADPYVQGFQMVSTQLFSTLEKFGLSRVAVDGAEFDPNIHEAISQIPSDEVNEGVIVDCTRAGYLLGDKLLRAAQVVVSSGPAES